MNAANLKVAQQILAQNEVLIGLISGDTPAKAARPTRKATPKAAPKKRAPKKAAKAKAPTKGSQTRETLSRKEWNRTLTAKARLAGGDTYRRVQDAWAEVQEARKDGFTPDGVLAMFV